MTDMKEVHVLCSVRVSDDGVRVRSLVGGTDDKVPSALFAGLEAAGFVRTREGAQSLPVAAEPKAKPSRRTRKEE